MDIETELTQLDPLWPRTGVVTTLSAFGGAMAGTLALLALTFVPTTVALSVVMAVAATMIIVGIPVGGIAIGLSAIVAGKNAARRSELLDEKRQLSF